jgi:glycosyltransferase involved in cell wall biosynthesis
VLETLLLGLAIVVLALWLGSAVEMIVNGRAISRLPELPVSAPNDTLPMVSVVVAARNEEETIAPALQALLALDYDDLEIVVVNDRSTDRTGSILDDEAGRSERLRVIHVESLPQGWLGKNHALAVGAAKARGDWILFTDADVHLTPLSLDRAVGYAEKQGLDHLAVAPRLEMNGLLLNLFSGAFALLFAQVTRPWLARRPGSRFHIGIGAFNLIRTRVYRSVGGHGPIRLRPDDDLRLGRLIKEAGFQQDLAFGQDEVVVEWYSSIGEAMRGLEKNSFSAVNYSLPMALLAGTLATLMGVYPFVALLFSSGAALVIHAITCSLAVLLFAGSTRTSGSGILLAPAFPLAAFLVLFIVGRATAMTLLKDGVTWRGTHYTLRELKTNRSFLPAEDLSVPGLRNSRNSALDRREDSEEERERRQEAERAKPQVSAGSGEGEPIGAERLRQPTRVGNQPEEPRA